MGGASGDGDSELSEGGGSISRGRGDAAMTWGEESPGSTDRFDVKPLPPSGERNPSESAALGVTISDPEASPEHEAAGLLDTQASAGKVAWRRRLAPRHRDAVKSYFTEPKPK